MDPRVSPPACDRVMSMEAIHSRLGWIKSNPCAWLFFGLLVLLVGLPYAGSGVHGRIIGAVLHDVILLAGALVLSRRRRSLSLAIGLALPVVAFQFAEIAHDEPGVFIEGWLFAILFYLLMLVYLMRYVLSSATMSVDKLYGAAAAYLMLGVAWYYAYVVVQHFLPGSFAIQGAAVPVVSRFELIYFSFTVLTSTGFGDIVPLSAPARSLANLESICGILFVAILIARLVGAYSEMTNRKT